MGNKRRILLNDDDLICGFSNPDEAHVAILAANARAKALTRDPGNVGKRFRITVGEDRETVSVRQRKFLHGPVLRQIAEQARVAGVSYVPQTWKFYFREMFLGATFEEVPGPRGPVSVEVRISSEDLSVPQYARYIEQVIAHAVTEYGVQFELDPREREVVEYRPLRLERKRLAREAANAPHASAEQEAAVA